MPRPLRLLSVGHSYCVERNRRLAHAMAREGHGRWEVTVAGPAVFPGDAGPIRLAVDPGEPCRVVPVGVRLARRLPLMLYGNDLRRLLGEAWDVVHCWEEPFVASAAQVARWSPPSATLVYATFQNLPRRYPAPFRWTEAACLRRAAGWIAHGETVREALAARPGYAERPSVFIPPAVDVEAFRPDAAARAATRQALGWDDDAPVVGYVGRLVPEKGVGTLLAALDRVPAPWRLLVVGDGPGEAGVKAWAAAHAGRVHVATGVAHADVPAWMAALDVLCVPSLTTPRWKEQFGRVIVEAFACAVPVLGSDSGEIPRVLDGVGEVAREGDAAAWAQALSGLLADPGRRRRLGERGRERASQRYALPVVARAHLDFFDALRDRAT